MATEATKEVKQDPFAPLRALVEQMVKDAYEDGQKAGLREGRRNGLRRACALLGITLGKLSLEDRGKFAEVVDVIQDEVTK
jgi:hypothetical protein